MALSRQVAEKYIKELRFIQRWRDTNFDQASINTGFVLKNSYSSNIKSNDVIRTFPRELPLNCESNLRVEANRVERSSTITNEVSEERRSCRHSEKNKGVSSAIYCYA